MAKFLSTMTIAIPPSRSATDRLPDFARDQRRQAFGRFVRIRIRGLVISARLMVSICCSPPDNCVPRCARRSANRGNVCSTRASVQLARAARVAARRHQQVLAHAMRLGKRRASRDVGEPQAGDAETAPSRSPLSRRGVTVPARGCTSPSMERISVVLPMPFRPMSATASPSATEKSTPCRTWLLP